MGRQTSHVFLCICKVGTLLQRWSNGEQEPHAGCETFPEIIAALGSPHVVHVPICSTVKDLHYLHNTRVGRPIPMYFLLEEYSHAISFGQQSFINHYYS